MQFYNHRKHVIELSCAQTKLNFFNFRFEKINCRERINVGPISCLGGSANRTTWRSQLRTKNLAVSQPAYAEVEESQILSSITPRHGFTKPPHFHH